MSFVGLRIFRRISTDICKQNTVYKSQYSVDKLYAVSDKQFSPVAERKSTSQAKTTSFSGVIPLEELQISYNRSSGPGGQNVNKVNSKVEIRFHVGTAKWIPEDIRPKLLLAEAGRITKDGFLVIKSEKTRSQLLNQADCLDRLRTMIRTTDVKPYEPTQEDIDLIRRRQDKARSAMLREKKDHSMKKQARQSPSTFDT